MKTNRLTPVRRTAGAVAARPWLFGLLLGLTAAALKVGSVPATDPDPVLVGQYPPGGEGTVEAIAISGGYACVAFGGAGLQILDVRNPAEPRRVGMYDAPQRIMDVVAQDNYAYVRLKNVPGFLVLDVSDWTNPRKVGSYQSPYAELGWFSVGLGVSGGYAYLFIRQWIEVIDISNPRAPTFIGKINESGDWGEGGGYQRIGTAGSVLCVLGRYWSETGGKGRLFLIDVSNPAQPQPLGSCDLLTDPYGGSVVIKNNYAYVGGVGLTVVDISDRAHPNAVGSLDHIADYHGSSVAVSGNLAAMGGDALSVIDVSDPTKPQRLGQYALMGYATGVALSGHHAYVGDREYGVRVIDASAPENPQHVGGYRHSIQSARAVAVAGDYAYVGENLSREEAAGRLQIIDVSQLNAPRHVGEYETDGWLDRIKVSGGFVHQLAHWWPETQSEFGVDTRARYEIVDVSNSLLPTRVGFYETHRAATDLEVSGRNAYLLLSVDLAEHAADSPASLQVLDIMDASHPNLVGEYVVGGAAVDVALAGNYAYIAGNRWDNEANDEQGSLHIIDVSEPVNPRGVSIHQVTGTAHAVAVVGHHASLVASSRCSGLSLLIIDISDPVHPRERGRCHLGSGLLAPVVVASGRYACVAGSVCLEIVDILDPDQPQQVGAWKGGGMTSDVVISGRYAYATDLNPGGWGSDTLSPVGLVILDLDNPACLQRLGSVELRPGAAEAQRRADGVAVAGQHTYVISSGQICDTNSCSPSTNLLQVIDTSNPSNPQCLGQCDIGELCVGQRAIGLSGSHAFVARGAYKIHIANIVDAGHPVKVGELDTDGSVAAVAAAGDCLYAAGSRGSIPPGEMDRARFEVFDLRNCPNLQRVGLLEMPGQARDLALSGRYAYLTGDHFEVIDISEPANPRRVGGCQGLGGGQIAVSAGRACVLGDGLLRVFDVAVATSPHLIGECECVNGAADIALEKDYAYVAVWRGGVRVFDIRDPAHPRHVGGNSAFDAYGLAIADGRLHVAAGDQGLVILNLYQPLRLESPHLEAAGFHLLLRGATGQMMRVERSRNLLDWETVATVPIPASGQTLIDPAATAEPRLFYRAMTVP